MSEADGNKAHILSVNSGSSSLKFGLFLPEGEMTTVYSGSVERIGLANSRFQVRNGSGDIIAQESDGLPDQSAATDRMLAWLDHDVGPVSLGAIGHRLVHGGTEFAEPQFITDEVEDRLRGLVPLAPDHMRRELEVLERLKQAYPSVAQVACFDTSFHRRMPRVAQMYALPRRMFDHGILRFGFHGLSYEYILDQLRRSEEYKTSEIRIIIAHLGNGASMAAIRNGRSIDTTMGFTPAGGLMMGTRAGDVDPGIFPHLLSHQRWPASALSELISEKSGLLGVSGISSDMRDLLEMQADHANAAEAVELFCYQARKYLGALLSVLSGADLIVFTGGIGENAPDIRQRICSGLEYAGIYIDEDRNNSRDALISAKDSAVPIRVMETNEELMVARHTGNLIARVAGVGYEQDEN